MTQSTTSGYGCLPKVLLGCGALVLLVVLTTVGSCMWLKQPGEQVETTSIVGEESLGMATLEDLAADEGVGALLIAAMRELESRESANLPRWFPRKRRSAEDLAPMLPTRITVSLEDLGAEEGPAILAAANFRSWVRFFQFMFVRFQNGGAHSTYRDHKLVDLGDVSIVFHEGTVLVSNEVAALRLAIDRILDGTGTAVATPLPPGTLPVGDWDAAGGLVNDAGSIDRLFRGEGAEGEPFDLGPNASLGFGIDVESADRAHARVQIVGAEGGSSDMAAARLGELASSIEARLERHVDVEASTRTEDGSIMLDLELGGLEDALLKAFERLDSMTDSMTDAARRERRDAETAPPATPEPEAPPSRPQIEAPPSAGPP